MDPGLSDYKTNSFVDDHSSAFGNYVSTDKLTSGEKEFVKMIGAGYQEDNDRLPYLNEYMISNGWNPDWSVAEHMMDYLNKGKILNVGLYLKMDQDIQLQYMITITIMLENLFSEYTILTFHRIIWMMWS